MNRRALLLAIDYPPVGGGMSRHAAAAAQALYEQGMLAGLVVPAGSREGVIPSVQYLSVRHEEVFRRYWRTVGEFFCAGSRALRRERAVMVLAHTWSPCAVAAYLLRAVYGIPYAVLAHGLDVYAPQGIARTRLMMKLVLSGAAEMIAISRNTASLVRRVVPRSRMDIINPLLEDGRIRSFASAPSGRGVGGPRLLSVGRLVPHKGHACVIRALPAVARHFPDVTYAIAGRGPCENDLRAQAGACGVADRTEFLGYVPDDELPALYASCDIFVLASEERPDTGDVEGFGIVFLEAAASGKPVVAFRSGGVPDAVVDGETGLLVAPGDTDALADAVCRLLADPGRAREMGEKGRQRVQLSFNARAFAERVRMIMEKI